MKQSENILEEEFRLYQVDSLSQGLKDAITSGSEYKLAQATQAMSLFCDFIDPTWQIRNKDAERLRNAATALAAAMDSVDTEAIERFVELGR